MESTQRKFLENPQENANIFSNIFFMWTIPLFKKGYGKVLQMEDVFRSLIADQSDSLGDRLEK